jgi:hypothetical protein
MAADVAEGGFGVGFTLTPGRTMARGAAVDICRGERWTLEPGRMEKAFQHAGWEAPMATEMLFCE